MLGCLLNYDKLTNNERELIELLRLEMACADECVDLEDLSDKILDIVSDYFVTHRGTCFHCGGNQVIWDSDFSFDDYGLEGEGIVHVCHCADCGAEITYSIKC